MAPGCGRQRPTPIPVGCGPFKFKSWKRFDTCELVRFENYWETDAEGNALPYLDGMIGKPKKEDRVRLTALRTNEVDLIDNVAYADAPNFIKEHGGSYDTWLVPQVGTAFIAFNLNKGPFSAEGQSRGPNAAHGGRARDRPSGHPRSGVQQPGRDRKGVLQRVQPVARQGHRVVAAIRSRQGQGDAQEGQWRRREAANHCQRQLPLHAAIGRAGARDAQGRRVRRDLRDPSRHL